ncbi:hypothetical protein MAR_003312 [Mya arenaria]|uniref:Uncharacterized protein n=1 Tax=Mya arenaria TaxID=6604 RepID=A0ABY7G878_MYAAR|nr:hypothetical protein MAR_003312 [Mya arenaria]
MSLPIMLDKLRNMKNTAHGAVPSTTKRAVKRTGGLVTVKLDFVGSCSTLVAEELLDDPDFLLDKIVAELLYGLLNMEILEKDLKMISDTLDNAPDVDLELELLTPPFPDLSVFNQTNVTASRKQELSDGSSTPYTPQNSFRDDLEGLTRDRSLPSLNNSSMLEKVQKKRDSLGDLLDQDQSESTELDFEQLKTNKPGNPFGDFTDGDVLMSSAGFNDAKVINPFIVIDDEKDLEQIDSLDHVPFTPVNTFVERNGEEFMKQRNSLTDPELIDKLNELKSKSDEDLEKGTNPFETSVSDDFHDGNQNVQTGSQDLLDIFGPVDGENLTQSTNLNPFLNMGENPANSVQRSDLEDIFGLESPENDNSVLLDKMLTQANQEAAEAVANSVSKEIIGTTLETFPNMTNPKMAIGVAMEILKMETSDWTKQK